MRLPICNCNRGFYYDYAAKCQAVQGKQVAFSVPINIMEIELS